VFNSAGAELTQGDIGEAGGGDETNRRLGA
jgi:hypothetical protein